MLMRRVDPVTNDWCYGKGVNDYLAGEAALEQNVKTRLQEWQNDCPFNMQAGIDYINLFGKGQENNLTLAIKAVILQSEGVLGVRDIAVTLDENRHFSITGAMDTIYGTDFQINTGS